MAGFHGDNAPAADAGYLAFAESLPAGEVAGIIRDEEPAGQIVTHRLPSSQWRHFKKVKRHPGRFLAMGDFCYPQTTGPKPPLADHLNRYVKNAVIAAQHDPAVAAAIYQVQNLLAPPPSLMRPAVVMGHCDRLARARPEVRSALPPR